MNITEQRFITHYRGKFVKKYGWWVIGIKVRASEMIRELYDSRKGAPETTIGLREEEARGNKSLFTNSKEA